MSDHASTNDIESLLSHTDWLHALARRLVVDANRVDDVVQETWVAALLSPPRESGSERSWLARVLQRVAGREGVRDQRRTERERIVARPERVLSTAEIVERANSQRVLVNQVLDLSEPYRSTLLLRFFENLRLEEIAEREGVPASTVRSRLQRGLQKLRTRLDRHYEVDDRDWVSALSVVAGLNISGVTTGATEGAGQGSLIGAPSNLPPGSLSSSIQVAAAATLGLTLIVLAVFVDRSSDAPERVELSRFEAEASERALSRRTDAEREEAFEPSGGSGEPKPLETYPSDGGHEHIVAVESEVLPAGVIEVWVERSRKPASGWVHVLDKQVRPSLYWLPRNAFDEHEGVSHHALDGTGRVRLEGLAVGHYQIGVEVGDGQIEQRQVSLTPGGDGKRVLFVLGSGTVHGFVYDKQGEPVAGARVHGYFEPRAASPGEATKFIVRPSADDQFSTDLRSDIGREGARVSLPGELVNASVIVETGDDGSFRLLHVPAGWCGVGVTRREADGPRRVQNKHVWVDVGAREELSIGRPFALPVIRGHVTDKSGRGIVNVGSTNLSGRLLLYVSGRVDAVQIPYGTDGSFEASIEPGRYQAFVCSPHSSVEHRIGPVEVGEPGLERDFILPGSRVKGKLPDGTSCRTVSLATPTSNDANASTWFIAQTKVSADGSYAFEGIPAGTWRLVGTGNVDLGTIEVE